MTKITNQYIEKYLRAMIPLIGNVSCVPRPDGQLDLTMTQEELIKQMAGRLIAIIQEETKDSEDRLINRFVKIIEEYEVKKQPLCEQNTLLFSIKERVKRN